MASQLTEFLEPIADWFAQFGTPEPIVHWGHPAMMGIVIFVMGSYTAWAGWRGRTAQDAEVKTKAWTDHKKLAPLMFLFITLGYTGGILSLVMQGQSILESPHFWTGSAAVGILGLNGVISGTKFGGGKAVLRSTHAYIGSAAMVLLFIHAALGLRLGLSL
ncbi:DUF4079 domain-containing protein [Leptolyngbya sp. PCC 6406]|uniref:DUF4079 domain-containing protein n=1 Tax=Leptolyngbya sp. PCC 6406 TaxID=1173264 RepID=UPI0002AD19A8|nr:DUF4079 domain-containing protein [Leptolyngbya sp. PCC 6406]